MMPYKKYGYCSDWDYVGGFLACRARGFLAYCLRIKKDQGMARVIHPQSDAKVLLR